MRHRLAVAYDVDCFSPIEIVTAIGEDCDLIWVVDSSHPLGPMSMMLPRTGTVVDIANLSLDAAIAEVRKCGPQGIVAFSDSQLSTAAVIASGLKLRHNEPAVTRLFLDKYEQRIALRNAGFVMPGIASIPADVTAADVVAHTAHLMFPVVMKPRNGSGSRDTYRVETADELVQLLAPTRGDRIAAGTEYVVEEYLTDSTAPGERDFADYVSVESVVVDRRARHLGVTGKFPLAEPFRETGNFTPSLLAGADLEAVIALADGVIAALGVGYGCLHTEIKLTPSGPRLIESNARVGGGGIENLFVMSYGQSLVELAAKTALGVELPERIELRSGDVAYQLFVQAPVSARRIVRIDGLDRVSALPGVANVRQHLHAGDPIDWRLGSLEWVLTIGGSVSDHDALRRLRAQILDALDLVYE